MTLPLSPGLPLSPFAWPGTLVGVGMTAFSRIVPAYFVENYQIVTLRETNDLSIVREKAPVFCLEEEMQESFPESGANSARLLSHPSVVRFLRGLPSPVHLFLYQSYPEIEELAEREGWKILANPSSLRARLAGREGFVETAGELGLSTPPGEIVAETDLQDKDYAHWARRLGNRFVVQLTDLAQGGGRGTFFITSADDYARLRSNLRTHTWRGTPITRALLRRFIEGRPVSVAVCVMERALLHSRLQSQIIDTLPFDTAERGVFCGHTWDDEPWPPGVETEVRRQSSLLAGHLRNMGYRGILGIDFILSRKGDIHALEINPRLTGAFPALSLFHMAAGRMPMEAFHLAAFSESAGPSELKQIDALFTLPVKGSHLLLFNGGSPNGSRSAAPSSGLYDFETGSLEARLIKPGCDVELLQARSQFLLLESPVRRQADPGSTPDPLARAGHLLYNYPIAGRNGHLLAEAGKAVAWFYRQIKGDTVS